MDEYGGSMENRCRFLLEVYEKIRELDLARKVKAAVGCPVMVVGGFRSYEVAKKAIRDDGMDYISMARPLIREPGLPNRWIKGDRARPGVYLAANALWPASKKAVFIV